MFQDTLENLCCWLDPVAFRKVVRNQGSSLPWFGKRAGFGLCRSRNRSHSRAASRAASPGDALET